MKIMRSFKKILLVVALLAGGNYAFAAPQTIEKTDSLQTVERPVSSFNGIKIAGPFIVHITQGSTESLKFEAPAEIISRIVTDVSGHTLKIHNAHDNWSTGEKSWYSEKSWWRHHKKIVVYVTAKNLNSISISGSGNVILENGVTSDALKLRVRGSGDMLGKIEVKTLKSSISGSGHIRISGTAGNSTVKVTGSGNFEAPELVTSNSAIHVSGSGGVKVNASDKIDAAISGSGGVSYTGTAKVSTRKSGSGSISRF